MIRPPYTVVLATLPAALIGAWDLGGRLSAEQVSTWPSWLGPTPFAIAILILSSRVLVAAVVSRFWAEVFARSRGRPTDEGWFAMAWLFALVLPAGTSLTALAAGMSFGTVFGCHVFGGTGRYIVSPTVLGMVFLAAAYPTLMADHWVPGATTASTWQSLANANDIIVREPGTWTAIFLGHEVAAPGTGSTLACLAGAAALVALRVADARIVIGGLLGLWLASLASTWLPSHWQLAVGNFAFALAFVATDRSTQPTRLLGRWVFGALFGALTILLRTGSAEHPEGTWTALLLATLCVPLIDRLTNLGALAQHRPSSTTDG